MESTNDKIFVSYSRHDEAFARKLALWLAKTLNMGVWIDVDDIQPGVKWSAAIQDGLDNCEVMVVIVTPESMESVNVEDEWQYFIDLGKPVVPILVRSAVVPYQLRRIQWIDFSEPEEYNDSLRQLIVELRKHLSPIGGESAASGTSKRGKSKAAVAQSKRAQHTVDRINKAEKLLLRQEKALKRNNRVIYFLFGLLTIIVLGVAAFFGWILLNQPDVFYIRGNTAGAFAVLPGSDGAVTLASLEGSAPVGTVIRAGTTPLQLQSESGQVEAVVQPDGIVGVTEISDDNVDLTLEDGNVSVETGGAQGQVNTPYGVEINTNQNIEVIVDPETDEVQASCYEGNCTLTDETDGRSLDLEGGQSITFNGEDRDFSADNIIEIPGSVAFVTNRHGASELYLMRPDGENQTRLTQNTGVRDEAPSWSPNGSQIAFVTTRNGTFDIAVVSSIDGSDVTILTDNSAADTDPAWSPNGQFIAFVSNRTGTDQIYVMNADGTDVIQLTTEGGNYPTWSADSTRIAFSSTRTGNADIFALDLTDEEAIPSNITLNPASDSEPVWSPDGTKIAFVSNRDNNEEIYVIDLLADETEPLNISQDSGRDFDPTWSPDSNRIMFTSERFGSLDIISVAIDNPDNVVQLTSGISTSDQEPAWLPILRAGG